MSSVEYSRAAISDLDEIWDYTFETWGVDQAERYVRGIRAACESLASERAGQIADARPGYLRHRVSRHVIFFRRLDGGVLVVRVLHERMDAMRHLGDGG